MNLNKFGQIWKEINQMLNNAIIQSECSGAEFQTYIDVVSMRKLFNQL